eukprot:2517177-Rhodomonas_salina.2
MPSEGFVGGVPSKRERSDGDIGVGVNGNSEHLSKLNSTQHPSSPPPSQTRVDFSPIAFHSIDAASAEPSTGVSFEAVAVGPSKKSKKSQQTSSVEEEIVLTADAMVVVLSDEESENVGTGSKPKGDEPVAAKRQMYTATEGHWARGEDGTKVWQAQTIAAGSAAGEAGSLGDDRAVVPVKKEKQKRAVAAVNKGWSEEVLAVWKYVHDDDAAWSYEGNKLVGKEGKRSRAQGVGRTEGYITAWKGLSDGSEQFRMVFLDGTTEDLSQGEAQAATTAKGLGHSKITYGFSIEFAI